MESALQTEVCQIVDSFGLYICQNRDDTLSAHGHKGHDLIVVAGPEIHLVPAKGDSLRDQREVAAGLLDPVDHGVLGKLVISRCLKAGSGAAGDMVEDDGGMYPVCQISVMLDQTLLSSLVVVGSHHQQTVRSGGFGMLGEDESGGGVVAAGAGNDLTAAGYLVNSILDRYHMLLHGLGGGLAGGAANTDGVSAARNLELDQLTQPVVIDAIRLVGGDDGDTRAGKNRLLHIALLLSRDGRVEVNYLRVI